MSVTAAAAAAADGLSAMLPPSSPSSTSLSPSSVSSVSSVCASVSSCLSEWRAVGLDSIRPSLDRSALALSDEEDRASAARQSLSNQSKALKRAGADEKLSMLSAVVKAYQEEINALTRRSKAAETAFLSLYQRLTTAPNPAPTLQQALTALQQAASMESEWTRSKQQVDELDRELSTLKNQDATLRRLEAQVRDVDKRTEQRVREAIVEYDEAGRQQTSNERREAAERETALKHAVDECRHAMAQQAAAHQQQQNAHFRESEKHEKAARDTEREIDTLRADNERLTHQMQAIHSQRAAEERERQHAGSPSSASSTSHSASLSSSATELEAEVQSLREALSAVQVDSAESHEALQRERAERVADRQAAAEQMERLTLQIAQWKHKALTSNSSGEQQHDEGDTQVNGGKDGMSSGDMQSTVDDALLTELAAARASTEQLTIQMEEQQSSAHTRIQQLSSAVEEAERTSMQHMQLVAQLEADISALQQQQQSQPIHPSQQRHSTANSRISHPFVPLSSLVTSPSTSPSSPHIHSTPSAPSAAAVSGTVNSSVSGPVSSSSAPPACCSCSSLLRIVSGQRDRLRVRVEQLEREVSDRQSALVEARSAKQQLQDDNVALYEKLQYVKSFEQHSHSQQPQAQQHANRTSGRGTSHQSSSSPFSHSVSVDSGSGSSSDSVGSSLSSALSERRYAKLYAESLNPFSAWKSGQMLANEWSLPPSERVTLTCVRLVFSRRAARSFAFFYALVLHLLVFVVLWTHTVSDHCTSVEDT